MYNLYVQQEIFRRADKHEERRTLKAEFDDVIEGVQIHDSDRYGHLYLLECKLQEFVLERSEEFFELYPRLWSRVKECFCVECYMRDMSKPPETSRNSIASDTQSPSSNISPPLNATATPTTPSPRAVSSGLTSQDYHTANARRSLKSIKDLTQELETLVNDYPANITPRIDTLLLTYLHICHKQHREACLVFIPENERGIYSKHYIPNKNDSLRDVVRSLRLKINYYPSGFERDADEQLWGKVHKTWCLVKRLTPNMVSGPLAVLRTILAGEPKGETLLAGDVDELAECIVKEIGRRKDALAVGVADVATEEKKEGLAPVGLEEILRRFVVFYTADFEVLFPEIWMPVAIPQTPPNQQRGHHQSRTGYEPGAGAEYGSQQGPQDEELEESVDGEVESDDDDVFL
ncbi:hypothetical protein EJ08DRAFT_728648 [Tothia fuscella]|uniref:Uncharacterized protein n=1 Tax=Tothia fuscella TaxID=1048955 RepID=A0A9P4P442_9PEZI|nr:hypothetical protein EJ08DRAFT_728648 [Tothia fuscella]